LRAHIGVILLAWIICIPVNLFILTSLNMYKQHRMGRIEREVVATNFKTALIICSSETKQYWHLAWGEN